MNKDIKIKSLIVILLLNQVCFSEENENKIPIKIFYYPFCVSTLIPLSAEELIKIAVISIEKEININDYNIIKQKINGINFIKPEELSIIRIPSIEEETNSQEIYFSPYINARLVISFLADKDNLFITIGRNHIYSINNDLFILNDSFLMFVCDLLGLIEQDQMRVNILNYFNLDAP